MELKEPAFAAPALFVDTDARALAREILQLSPDTYATAFRDSAIKRAKLWMLKRNASVVLGHIGTPEDASILAGALADQDPIVRAHAKWAFRRIRH